VERGVAEETGTETGAADEVGARPERKAATRQRILDAALEVFADRGYHEAVVDEIVRVSRTSKGAFYFHFPSKQDIFLRLVDELIERLARKVEAAIELAEGPEAKVDAALVAVFDAFAGHHQIAKILLVDVVGLGRAFDQKLLGARGKLAGVIQRYLDAAVAEGSIPPLDTELAAAVWLGAINEVVVRWLHTGRPESLDAARPTLRRLLLSGVGLTSSPATAAVSSKRPN
jgi:TetR/AcrR family transcriptional regulator, fatty acid metabolism regulator protein